MYSDPESVFPAGLANDNNSWNSPDDQVDDAEVENLLVGVVVGDLLLLFLDLPHQLFSLLDQDDMRRKQRRDRTDSYCELKTKVTTPVTRLLLI